MSESQKGDVELEFRHKKVFTILFVWCTRTGREIIYGDSSQ